MNPRAGWIQSDTGEWERTDKRAIIRSEGFSFAAYLYFSNPRTGRQWREGGFRNDLQARRWADRKIKAHIKATT